MTDEVLRKLKTPAIGMIATGVINAVYGILSIIGNIYQYVTKQGTFADSSELDTLHVRAVIGILLPVISLAFSPLIIFGAVQMMKGRNYGWSKNAAIFAVIPFTSCCFLIGVPFGIWALRILSQPDVKAFFNGDAMLRPFDPPPPPQN